MPLVELIPQVVDVFLSLYMFMLQLHDQLALHLLSYECVTLKQLQFFAAFKETLALHCLGFSLPPSHFFETLSLLMVSPT